MSEHPGESAEPEPESQQGEAPPVPRSGGSSTPQHGREVSSGQAIVRYTTLRIVLFVVVLAVTYVVGLRGLLLLVLALLASGLLSAVLLRRQREAVAAAVEARRLRPGTTGDDDRVAPDPGDD